MHGVKMDKYIKYVQADEEMPRPARKAIKRADGDEEKESKCVGEVVAPSAKGRKRKAVGLGIQARRNRGVHNNDTTVLQPSSTGRDRKKPPSKDF
jgi:hypothetical protein